MPDATLFTHDAGDDSQDSLFGSLLAERDYADRADLADPPVARVHLETAVPHLDRTFDYLVPAELGESAQPGVRVRAKFGHQNLNGFIVARLNTSDAQVQLQPLDKVLSTQRVLPEPSYELCQLVAARFAGTVADVLRSAVPPRVASVDKQFAEVAKAAANPEAEPAEPETSQLNQTETTTAWTSVKELYPAELANLGKRIAHGEQIRARVLTPQRYGPAGWPQYLISVLTAVKEAAKGASVVVPDQHALDLLEDELLAAGFGKEDYARLTAEDGPTPRYRNYLRLVNGEVKIAIGTRSAVFAPVAQQCVMIVLDDADHNHAEPRAPYWNTRDVALLRAQQENTSLLFVGSAPSVHTQRMVEIGYLEDFQPLRQKRADVYPRVIVAADEYYQEREYGPGSHRIPSVAWQVITRGLKSGPVLIQVARTGFIPAVRCVRCGVQARCRHCSGPLGYQNRAATEAGSLVCRWCGEHEHQPSCQECSSTVFKAAHRGAERTAEELGRAFSNTPVISSAGDHIKTVISQKPVLVVATPGAEPVVPEGYSAVVLLDGNTMLAREGLDTPAEVFHRWADAMALTKSHSNDGLCVITADPGPEVNTLARLDIPGYYAAVYQQRQQPQLPPARRFAAIDGAKVDVDAYLKHVAEQLKSTGHENEVLQLIGPAALDPEGEQVRMLAFFSYRDGNAVTAALRGSKAALSARKEYVHGPVRVRVDPEGIL